MAQNVFAFAVSNGQYVFESRTDDQFHMLSFDFSVPPNGTLKIETQAFGAPPTDWQPVYGASGIPLTSPVKSVSFVAPIARYRFTVAGASITAIVTVTDLSNSSGSGFPPGAFTGTRALTTQSYTEANVKLGTQFETASLNSSLSAGANFDIIVKTGALPITVKSRQIAFTGTGMTARVYKGTSYAGGTPVAVFNLSDRVANPSTVTVLSAPTISSVGTEFGAPTFGIGTEGSGNRPVSTYSVPGIERSLAANSTYLLRITNDDIASQKVSAYLTFYEGNTDLP